jgi:hypothetical protein
MYRSVFYWLLNKGLLRAALILNSIAYAILGVMLWILNWIIRR